MGFDPRWCTGEEAAFSILGVLVDLGREALFGCHFIVLLYVYIIVVPLLLSTYCPNAMPTIIDSWLCSSLPKPRYETKVVLYECGPPRRLLPFSYINDNTAFED